MNIMITSDAVQRYRTIRISGIRLGTRGCKPAGLANLQPIGEADG